MGTPPEHGQATPPSEQITLEKILAVLDRLHEQNISPTPGTMPNNQGKNADGRLGDVRDLLLKEFPVFAMNAGMEVGGLFFGPEDVAILAIVKANKLLKVGFIFKNGKRTAALFKGEKLLKATDPEAKAIIKQYNEALIKQGLPPRLPEASPGLGHNPKGGPYGEVRAGNNGGQVHHTPAAAVTPYSRIKGPSVWMETADHMKTGSWGSGKAAKAFRQKQAELIAEGKLREAIQMDIDDIRSLFGSKYDEYIKQMLKAFGFSE